MYKPSSSIFNKAFREQFNQNKYMNLTGIKIVDMLSIT